MKELSNISKRYSQLKASGDNMVLATVVDVEGSSYRRPGARMLIEKQGQWIGGVSGGCLEGDLLKKAMQVFQTSIPRLVRYDTREEESNEIGVGLGCRGLINIWLEYIDPGDADNSIEQIQGILNRDSVQYRLQVLDTDKSKQTKAWIFGNKEDIMEKLDSEAWPVELCNEILNRIQQGFSGLCHDISKTDSDFKVFIEIIEPKPLIYICGYEYDTIPILELCRQLSWRSCLICKASKMSKLQYELADQHIDINESKEHLKKATDRTVVLLMTHDYKTDLDYLKACLQSEAFYIGLLGPRSRGERLLAESGNESICDESISRIYYPTGLDIGARQPEEIAISIFSEIMAVRSDRSGGPLKGRHAPIYDRYKR